MVEEVAAVILKLHQGGGCHANTTRCQHQAEATTSDREIEEEQEKENKISRRRHQGVMIRQYFISSLGIFFCISLLSKFPTPSVALSPKPICAYIRCKSLKMGHKYIVSFFKKAK